MNISAADFLSQAQNLLEGGIGRPKQADLRRAISNCYYAVFHTLTEESAKLIVSGSAREHFRQYVRRGYQHSHMRQVCNRFRLLATDQTQANSVVALMPLNLSQLTPELRSIALGFIELQADRHSADYDHTLIFGKEEARDIHSIAYHLCTSIRNLDKSSDANYGFLLAIFTGKLIQ